MEIYFTLALHVVSNCVNSTRMDYTHMDYTHMCGLYAYVDSTHVCIFHICVLYASVNYTHVCGLYTCVDSPCYCLELFPYSKVKLLIVISYIMLL